jgi:hypothetical protein
MFEDLKRLFRNEPAFVPARDGLTGGDPALMEMLDLSLLQGEAKACDIAAGRVAIKDRPARKAPSPISTARPSRKAGRPRDWNRPAAPCSAPNSLATRA